MKNLTIKKYSFLMVTSIFTTIFLLNCSSDSNNVKVPTSGKNSKEVLDIDRGNVGGGNCPDIVQPPNDAELIYDLTQWGSSFQAITNKSRADAIWDVADSMWTDEHDSTVARTNTFFLDNWALLAAYKSPFMNPNITSTHLSSIQGLLTYFSSHTNGEKKAKIDALSAQLNGFTGIPLDSAIVKFRSGN